MEDRPASRLNVRELTAGLSSLDITAHVKKNPQYPFAFASGDSADVYQAIYEIKGSFIVHVAVRILRGSFDESKMQKRFERELACWRGLKHPNIAELLGIASLIPGKPPGMVSKWVLRHDFLKFIGRHPELKQEKAKEIACGLQYLHEQGVTHGDLKADNVIVSDRTQAQLKGFGDARIQDVEGFTMTNHRTASNIRFMAPELIPLDDETSVVPSTTASDIFSLGMLLLQLFHSPDDNLQRRLPYNHVRFVPNFDTALWRRIHAGERPQRERYHVIEDLHWEIICKCWAGDPARRPTVKEVHDSL